MRKTLKPQALGPGSTVAVIAPASPAKPERIRRGCETLERLHFYVRDLTSQRPADGYFAGSAAERRKELQRALASEESSGVFCVRGGYGSTDLLEGLKTAAMKRAKIFCAFSDLTSVHIFLWQKLGWVTFYGPLVAGGLDAGPNATNGFDPDSFMLSMTGTNTGWPMPLRGESIVRGSASGILLGGCITLIETSLGTPWELDTRGSILVLEDRGVKPYQLDRMLVHLRQAGKFRGVRGIVLGEFPDSEATGGGGPTTADVCRHVLGPLGIPIVYGAPIGHTPRPMLTVPLGVRARLESAGEGRIQLLEPAVSA